MRIDVTPEEIREGRKATIDGCPVSRALTKAHGTMCLVDYDVISIDGQNYRPPEKVRQFIHSYDTGGTVSPFSFTTDELQPTTFTIYGERGLRGDVARLRHISKRFIIAASVVVMISCCAFITVAYLAAR